MKKILILFSLLLLTCHSALGQETKKQDASLPTTQPQQAIKLPEATAKQVKEIQAQIEQVQREIERLNLLKQNALLLGCLEVGVTKAQLEAGQLDVQGDALVIRPKTEEEKKKAQAVPSPTSPPK